MNTHKESAGKRFRNALATQFPLQIVGTINAYAAIMAKHAGFQALYLSGAGVANASYGLPDLGMTSLDNVLDEARKITYAVDTPLLVDIDTGWGAPPMIARTIRLMELSGVAAVHIEDQPFEKRCGHRPNKEVIPTREMVDRIAAASNAKSDPDFVIMSRTDAFAVEGLEKTIERCLAYENAGADMHFIEALTSLDQYSQFSKILNKPILANITEFGKTPLFTKDELAQAGVAMILYPLSAWRAMNLAALQVYKTIRDNGTQKNCLPIMQTREELYGFLNYEAQEQHFNELRQ